MPPADRIELRGLRLAAIVGVLPHERTTAQPLEIDLDVVTDLAPAGSSDELEDTIDYGALCDAVEAAVAAARPRLLEALAERVAATVLAQDDRIAEVVVALRKLRPPVPQQLDTSGVRITRRRP
ncbi:MAG TPA: dihydroneopterin aldolase [Acidimicrobiales bacterium]|nr:dihydroneopterin aldolase [Acidimicrobiales bacterium]